MINKILLWLIFVFIALLPSQLGKHWWPGWSLVSGVRVDYLSPTVYLTDILLFLLLISIFINHILSLRGVPTPGRDDAAIPTRLPRSLRSLAMTGAFYILFIILRTPHPWLAVYWLARYLEIPLVAFLILKIRRIRGERRIRRKIITALAIAVLFSAALGAAQMILGRTTGWFWWLGERSFNLATPGIATMTILGREVLRPYATFGHPNALAGFLAVGFWLMGERGRGIRGIRRIINTGRIAAAMGVILTGSRGATAGLVMGFGLWVVGRRVRMKRLAAVGVLIISSLVIGYRWNNTNKLVIFTTESSTERNILNRAAIKMWRENWAAGVGPGQFLAELPKYLPSGFYKIQPVHNVFLLGLAEFGVIGLIMGLMGLMSLMRQMNKMHSLKIWLAVLAVIFVTGMVDHYWLTAQQNRLLLGVILGLMISVLGRQSICDSGLRLRSRWQYPGGKKAQGGQSGVRPG